MQNTQRIDSDFSRQCAVVGDLLGARDSAGESSLALSARAAQQCVAAHGAHVMGRPASLVVDGFDWSGGSAALTPDHLAHALLTPEIAGSLSTAEKSNLLSRFKRETLEMDAKGPSAKVGLLAGAVSAGGMTATFAQLGAAVGAAEGMQAGLLAAFFTGMPQFIPAYGLIGAVSGAVAAPILPGALALTAAVSGAAVVLSGSQTYLSQKATQAQNQLLVDVLRLHLDLEQSACTFEEGKALLAALVAAIGKTTWTKKGARQLTASQAAIRVGQLLDNSIAAREMGAQPSSR